MAKFLDNGNEIDAPYIAQVRVAMGTLQGGQLEHRGQTLSFQNLLNMQYKASNGTPSFREEIPITNGTNTKYHLHYIKNDDDSIRIFELQDEERNSIGIFQTSNSKTENKAIEDRGAFLSEGGGLSFQPNSTTSSEQARGALTFIANNLEKLRLAIVDSAYTLPTASQSPVVAPDAQALQLRRQDTLERVKEQRKQSLIDETKAAVKIQRAFREHKRLDSHYGTEEEEVQAILAATDEEHGAAIKIQNAFRAYQARKELNRLKAEKAKKEGGLDDPEAADSHNKDMEDQYAKLPQGEELGDDVLNRIERNEEIRTFGNEDQTDYAKNGLLNFVGSGFNNKKTKHPHDRIKMDEFGLFTAHYDNKRAMHVLDYASASRFANSAIIRKSNTSPDISDFQFIAYDNERFAFRSENGLDSTFDPEADVKEVSPPELIFTDPATGQPKKIIGAEVEVIRAKIQDGLRAQNAITDEQEDIKKQILDHIKDPEKPAPAGYDAQIANFKSIIGIEDGQKYKAEDIEARVSDPQVAEKLRREIKFSNTSKLPADLAAKLKKKGKDDSGADIEIDVSPEEREKILASYERHANRDTSRQIMSEIAKEETLEQDSLGQLDDFVDHIKSNSSDRASSIFKDIDKFPVISGQDGIATSVAPTPNAGPKHRTANTGKISFNFNGKNPEEKEQFMEIPGTGLFARVKYVPNGTQYTVWKDGKPDYKTAEGDQVVIDKNTLWKKSYNKDGNPITVPFKVNSTSRFSSGPSDELKKGKIVPDPSHPSGKKIAESGFIDPDFIARRYNEFAIEAIAQIDKQVTCASYKSLDKGKVVAVNPSTTSIDIIRKIDREIEEAVDQGKTFTDPEVIELMSKRETQLDRTLGSGIDTIEYTNQGISEFFTSTQTLDKVTPGTKPEAAIEALSETLKNPALLEMGGDDNKLAINAFRRRAVVYAVESAQKLYTAQSRENHLEKFLGILEEKLNKEGVAVSPDERTQFMKQFIAETKSYATARGEKTNSWFHGYNAIATKRVDAADNRHTEDKKQTEYARQAKALLESVSTKVEASQDPDPQELEKLKTVLLSMSADVKKDSKSGKGIKKGPNGAVQKLFELGGRDTLAKLQVLQKAKIIGYEHRVDIHESSRWNAIKDFQHVFDQSLYMTNKAQATIHKSYAEATNNFAYDLEQHAIKMHKAGESAKNITAYRRNYLKAAESRCEKFDANFTLSSVRSSGMKEVVAEVTVKSEQNDLAHQAVNAIEKATGRPGQESISDLQGKLKAVNELARKEFKATKGAKSGVFTALSKATNEEEINLPTNPNAFRTNYTSAVDNMAQIFKSNLSDRLTELQDEGHIKAEHRVDVNEFSRNVARYAVESAQHQIKANSKEATIAKVIEAANNKLTALGKFKTAEEVQAFNDSLNSNIAAYSQAREQNTSSVRGYGNVKQAADRATSDEGALHKGGRMELHKLEAECIDIMSRGGTGRNHVEDTLPHEIIEYVMDNAYNPAIETLKSKGLDIDAVRNGQNGEERLAIAKEAIEKLLEQNPGIDLLEFDPSPADRFTDEDREKLASLPPESINRVMQGYYEVEGYEYTLPEKPEAASLKWNHVGSLEMGDYSEKLTDLQSEIFEGYPVTDPDYQTPLNFMENRQFNTIAAEFTLDYAQKFKSHDDTTKREWKSRGGGNPIPTYDNWTKEQRDSFLGQAQGIVKVAVGDQEGLETFNEALEQAAADRAVETSGQKATKASMAISYDSGKTGNREDRKEHREAIKANAEDSTGKWVTKVQTERNEQVQEKQGAQKWVKTIKGDQEQGGGGITAG